MMPLAIDLSLLDRNGDVLYHAGRAITQGRDMAAYLALEGPHLEEFRRLRITERFKEAQMLANGLVSSVVLVKEP